jgi:hypothetical protein
MISLLNYIISQSRSWFSIWIEIIIIIMGRYIFHNACIVFLTLVNVGHGNVPSGSVVHAPVAEYIIHPYVRKHMSEQTAFVVIIFQPLDYKFKTNSRHVFYILPKVVIISVTNKFLLFDSCMCHLILQIVACHQRKLIFHTFIFTRKNIWDCLKDFILLILLKHFCLK